MRPGRRGRRGDLSTPAEPLVPQSNVQGFGAHRRRRVNAQNYTASARFAGSAQSCPAAAELQFWWLTQTAVNMPGVAPNGGHPGSDTSAAILLVCPDPGERLQLESWLSDAGHLVVSADDFAAASGLLESCRPDLVITDLRLGAYNGLHLAIRARFGPSRVPCIVLGDPDRVLEADAGRIDAVYLRRPVDAADLLAIIRRLLPAEGRLGPPPLRAPHSR